MRKKSLLKFSISIYPLLKEQKKNDFNIFVSILKLFHPIYVYTYIYLLVKKKKWKKTSEKKRGNIKHVFRIELNHE